MVLRVLLVAVFTVAVLMAAIGKAAEFRGLGDLPGGSYWSIATDVSADGSVVVGSAVSGPVEYANMYEAFRWTFDEGMIGLGPPIEADLTMPSSLVRAVNGDGQKLVGYATRNDDFVAAVWNSSGGLSYLGDEFTKPRMYSSAHGVSQDGSVVVGSVSFEAAIHEAYVWSEIGGMQLIAQLTSNVISSRALAVSPNGAVVLGVVSGADGQQAFRWTREEGLVMLGELPGGLFGSSPSAASYDGKVIVGDSRTADSLGGVEAFIWNAEMGMVALGDLPGGSFSSSASDVSADGRFVVGASSTELGPTAFIWDERHGMRDFQKVLESEYALAEVLSGWRLTRANAISADGKTIVGTAINPSGNVEAYQIRFDSAPVPEPSTIAIAASAILGYVIRTILACIRDVPRDVV